jgi:UDP-3-O-[3-hydroxymyristoyl] N-acetylglucosamine deacetylase
MKQKSLKKQVCFQGIGVHFGQRTKLIIKPAPCNTGIIFINKCNPCEIIEIGKIVPEEAMHASVMKNGSFVISTLEHLMATVSGLLIDNLVIEMEGVEVPIFDGSALCFLDSFLNVGIEEQEEPKRFLTPIEQIEFKDSTGRQICVLPAKFCEDLNSYDTNLYFDYTADFNHPLLGKSFLKGVFSQGFFLKEIAPARTFGFLEQLPLLRRHGLAKGTNLGNTVVIGEEEFLNERRFEDEFVRHKFLDLVGDLALLGKNLAGTISAQKTGHNFNRLVIQHYVNNPEKWRLIS